MSITYELDLGATTTPEAVVATMLEVAGIITEHDGNSGSLRGGGWFTVDVAEYDPPDPVLNQFGFAPIVETVFGLDKFHDLDAQRTDVIRLSLVVLDSFPGDALLHYQYDVVWLLRRAGRLTINDGLWTSQQLALLPQPYDRRRMAFA